MIDSLLANWWQALILLFGAVIVLCVSLYAFLQFIRKAKETGVDEITAGPVKVDFDDAP